MPILLAFGAGAVIGGFITAETLDAGGKIFRLAVIGGAGYLAAKHFKVI